MVRFFSIFSLHKSGSDFRSLPILPSTYGTAEPMAADPTGVYVGVRRELEAGAIYKLPL